MKRFIHFLAFLLILAPLTRGEAQQPPVLQSGTVTPGHAVQWTTDGVVQDAGTAAQGTLTSLGITAQGPSFCQNSDLVTNPFNELCFGVNTASAATISLTAFGGATPQQLCFNINGSVICLPLGFAGTIAISGTAPIVVNPTTGNISCLNFTNMVSGCVPASGGGTANFLRADGTFAVPSGSGIGTVTSATIAAGTGISVSGTCTITTTGTCTVANTGVTSVSTGCGSSASSSPITTTGTIFATEPLNAQTGTTYTVADGDCGKLTTFSNGSAVAVTLGQAGTGGFFAAGWFADYHNKGAGTVTITPTTSTVDGAATLVLLTGQGATIVSDGTNYQIVEIPPVIGPASATSGHIATFSGTSGKLIQDGGAPATGTLTSITCNGGLTGGTITTTGTCAVDIATNTNIWSGTANKPIDAAGNQSSLGVVAVAISTATFTPNFQQEINFSISLTSACPCTLANPSNAFNGLSGFIEVIQDGTGSRTITTYGSTWKFSGGVKPVLSTAASAKDVLPFFCDASNFCMVGAIQTAFQ